MIEATFGQIGQNRSVAQLHCQSQRLTIGIIHDFAPAHATGDLPDGVFAAAEARFGKPAILDLLAVCGYYAMLAMVLNTARPALPDGVVPPLAPLDRGTP